MQDDNAPYIDRVAEAIFSKTAGASMWPWDTLEEVHRNLYREMARAAVDAMAGVDRG